jgi:hypothetical protein
MRAFWQDHLSLIFFTPTDTPLEWVLWAIQHHRHQPKTNVITGPGRKRLTGSTQAAVLKEEHSRNQPFIQRDEDASTRTNKHKNVGFQRRRIFLLLPTRFSKNIGRKENRRKAQRLLPISTSTSPLLPPNNSHNNGCKAYKARSGPVG